MVLKYIQIGDMFYNGFSQLSKNKISLVEDKRDAISTNLPDIHIKKIKKKIGHKSNNGLCDKKIYVTS